MHIKFHTREMKGFSIEDLPRSLSQDLKLTKLENAVAEKPSVLETSDLIFLKPRLSLNRTLVLSLGYTLEIWAALKSTDFI